MVLNCGELDCKEVAVYQDRCGCVFCKKHKWHNHGGLRKVFDPLKTPVRFFSARSNDYLEGKREGFVEGQQKAYDGVLVLLKLKIHSEDQQRHLVQKIIELKEELK
jgi:hypothetical protein